MNRKVVFSLLLVIVITIGLFTIVLNLNKFTEPYISLLPKKLKTPPSPIPTIPKENDVYFSNSIYLHTDISHNVKDIGNPSNLLSLTGYDTSFNSQEYDPNNYDLQYHDPVDLILKDEDKISGSKGTWIKGENGKPVFVEWTDISMQTTYYPVGNFPFGPSNYVPTYDDTVLFRHYR
jgi:hypothetical protein